MDLGISGTTVIVTGGSRGMGRAAAESLAAEHARVAILAREAEAIEATVRSLEHLGATDTMGLVADLRSDVAVRDAIASVGGRWGALNALVNAAGPVGIGVGTFESLTDAEWFDTMDVGLMGAVRCTRHALPLLRQATWARIVNVSAHSTRRQAEQLIAYTASKAAMTSFSKNLSLTLAPDNILVNTVSPGSFLSDGLKNYLASLPEERGIDPDSLQDAMRVIGEDFGHPAHLGRAGDPREMGPLIAILCSPVLSYLTGADVNVDGGSDF